MTESAWFPRPRSTEDVISIAGMGGFGPSELVAMLTAEGEEWRTKVGVTGAQDGSAKASTRLFASGAWVFKTHLERRLVDGERLVRELEASARREGQLGLWHPSKHWFGLRVEGGFLPVSVCLRLTTLRSVEAREDRFASWRRALELGLRAYAEHGVGLDLNPANFAFERADGPLYYLDDELYRELTDPSVASFLAARIPEERDADEGEFRRHGAALRTTLAPLCPSEARLVELARAVEDYPLTESYADKRRALLEGLLAQPHRSTRRAPPTTRRTEVTCVIADVHANLPALEAVLAAAREAGADSYLFVGDAVGYGPHPRACVERLAELPNARFVRGNHDHAIATGRWERGANQLARECVAYTLADLGESQRAWLGGLPTEIVEDDLMAVHGAPKDPHHFLAYVYELTYEENLDYLRAHGRRLCFYGHTHVQYVHRWFQGLSEKMGAPREVQVQPRLYLLVNPGSVGQPRDGRPEAGFALFHRASGQLSLARVPYDVERTVRDLREAGLPNVLGERLAAGR